MLFRIMQSARPDYWALTSLYQERSNVSDLALETYHYSIKYHPVGPRTLRVAELASIRGREDDYSGDAFGFAHYRPHLHDCLHNA
jgi:hypothetical protein